MKYKKEDQIIKALLSGNNPIHTNPELFQDTIHDDPKWELRFVHKKLLEVVDVVERLMKE